MTRLTPAARRRQRQDRKEQDNAADRERRAPTRPLTPRQESYLHALRTSQMTASTGPAGTGKTYVAASYAADLFERGEISKFILARPAVAVEGEEHGFLPGSLDRKIAPWARPVVDVLKSRLGAAKVEEMLGAKVIEVIPFAFMRGLTFDSSFILLDEAQNTTELQMRMFLTRIGEDTRVAINGDISQKDIKKGSGLEMVLRLAPAYNIPCRIVSFTAADVVRSGICKQWILAFEAEDRPAETDRGGLMRTLEHI